MSVRIETLRLDHLAAAQALLQRSCAHDEVAPVAQEKLFGEGALSRRAEPLGSFADGELVAVACTSDRWLRLLAVDPRQRQRGIGSALLRCCEEQIAAHGQVARVLDQPGNYLSPGVDVTNSESIEWLVRRGFAACGQNTNLLLALAGNARVGPAPLADRIAACEERGYAIERLRADDIESCAAAIEKHFSRGWAFEVRRAAAFGGGAVHVARQLGTGELASFAAHDGNNQGLGWFGPTGTFEGHQRQGLAAALLLACLVDLLAAGHAQCQVAWIGPRGFYDKVAGIASQRNFTMLKKERSQ